MQEIINLSSVTGGPDILPIITESQFSTIIGTVDICN